MQSVSETQTPEQIRDRIRAEHYQIAQKLAKVESLTEAASRGGAEATLQLRGELEALGEMLLAHLHYEEYRIPSLTVEGEEAEAMAAMMREEHQAQRELLDRVIRDLDETAVGQQLVVGVRELALAIRDDMEHEEQELLSID